MKKTALLLSALGVSVAGVSAVAAPVPTDAIPLPRMRPAASQPVSAPSMEMTGAIPRVSPMSADSAVLKSGLDALSNRDAARAIAVRDTLPVGALDRHILTWAIAMSGQKGVPSFEIARAQRELQGWPGIAGLRGNSERALYRENPTPRATLAAFAATEPETPEGAVVLARALVATGEIARAARILRSFWREKTMDSGMEDTILAEFSALLTPADHKARMDLLMYRSRTTQAKRFAELGKAQSVYKAWAAVLGRAANADALIKAIDPIWAKDPATLFLRIERLRRQDDYEGAARLLGQIPKDSGALVDPGEWWAEQRIVSRDLADAGQYRAAYTIASNHVAKTAVDRVEAEFHAGWYALRGLKDGATAARHFRRILDASTRPVSASRAWYWLGRAAQAGGPGSAADYYARAAAYPTTFYGQLAAAKLNRKTINVAYPSPSSADRQRFQQREAVKAIDRLEKAGYAWRGDALYRALADDIDSPGELAILAASAEKSRNHQLSLQVGKLAYGRGLDVAALAFPVGVIPPSANISASGKALAYAIARQESAFDPTAISPADARGLLQLMPGTARLVAGRHGLPYSKDRLTSDAAYNATLGAHYLGEQIQSFGGSYVLTFIAYNAGPKRVPEWIARYGDPRGKSVDDVVDWIERIPFPETRGYVQRVMENYQVYKTRLGQTSDIASDLRMGRQG